MDAATFTGTETSAYLERENEIIIVIIIKGTKKKKRHLSALRQQPRVLFHMGILL